MPIKQTDSWGLCRHIVLSLVQRARKLGLHSSLGYVHIYSVYAYLLLEGERPAKVLVLSVGFVVVGGLNRTLFATMIVIMTMAIWDHGCVDDYDDGYYVYCSCFLRLSDRVPKP